MSTKNSEYWEDRIAKETWRTYNDIEEKNIDLIKMYDKTSQSIKKELYALAESAEETGSLTRSEQYRFNKLLGQQGHIYKEIEKLGEQVENHAKKQMFDGGKRVYGNIMDSLGVENYDYPNKKQMEQMLRRPWKGSFFSERLWKENGKLEKNLNGIIKEGMATGKTVTEMAVQLSNIMQKSFNDAHRLIRSETVTYLNRAAVSGYKDAGIKKVQWWAAEDERMCEICGAMHGKEYPVNDVPLTPHPNCRCTQIPVVGSSENLTTEEEGAIRKYTSPDAYTLNDKLRNGIKLTKADKHWMKDLDAALDKIPKYKGEVIRDLYFMHKVAKTDFIKNHEIGSTINYSQYISSTTKKVYNDIADVRISIISKSGRDIRYLNPKEQEVLFKQDTRFFIRNSFEKDGIYYIELEER